MLIILQLVLIIVIIRLLVEVKINLERWCDGRRKFIEDLKRDGSME